MITENDLYYLRSIQRQLQMVKESLDDSIGLSLGVMAFADNLNWLDCFIDEHERRGTDPMVGDKRRSGSVDSAPLAQSIEPPASSPLSSSAQSNGPTGLPSAFDSPVGAVIPPTGQPIDDNALWALASTLHSNVPEDQRPMSWSDYSPEQVERLRLAAEAFLASYSLTSNNSQGEN